MFLLEREYITMGENDRRAGAERTMHDIISGILGWLEQLGHWGIMIGLMIEVIPSEIVLSYGGYLVSQGQISFVGAVVFGTIGGVVAQLFVYWIGKYGGRPFLEKYGKYILIKQKHIEISEQWFDRYGTGVIFTARFIPVVRHAISIPAGIARMSLLRFTVLTTLAVIPWSIFFVWLGMTLGEQWEHIDEVAGPYVRPAMLAAIALTVVYFGWTWARGKRRRSERANGAGAAANEHASGSVVGAIAGAEASGSPASSAGPGTGGSVDVARALAALDDDYVVLRDVDVGGSGRELTIRYVVVGPAGVFPIAAIASGAEGDAAMRDGATAKADAGDALYRYEYALKELLREGGAVAEVKGVLVRSDAPASTGGGQSASAFIAARPDAVADAIRAHRAKKPLAPEAVQAAVALLRPRSAE